MTSFRRVIRHLFSGGWATDFGPTANARLDDAGFISVPFLVNAEDCLYELDGGPHKAPGTSRLNSTALESGATVKGLVDYWRHGTGGTATQQRVIHVGTTIQQDDADGNFTIIKTGLAADAVPNYSTFDDLLIIASDSSDVPLSWDGTTLQNLAGTPPNFAFSVKHKNFHWAAGIDATPSRLHFSDQLNPEDWVGGLSGTIDIDPNDGDRITGIISHKNELWVFKGPHKGSIHRITGTSQADFSRTTFIEGVGAVWQNTIFRFGDDIGWLWSDGSIRSLNATDAFGDFREASLTFPIQKYLTEHLNFTRLRHAVATTDGGGGKVFITAAIDSSSTNNVVLALDFRFTPARWSRLPVFKVATVATVLDADASLRPVTMFGSYEGFVLNWSNSTRSVEGAALSFKVTIPHLDYGFPAHLKTLAAGAIGVQPKNDGNVTVGWVRDNNAQQTIAVSQGGSSDVLGTASVNQFTLGTSTLGGAQFIDRWHEFDETGGDFRSVQYEFINSVNNEDVELHSFTSIIEPGAESTEN